MQIKRALLQVLFCGGEGGILRFASRSLRSALRGYGRRRSPGWANRPLDALILHPSNPFHHIKRALLQVLFCGGEGGI